MAEKFVKPTRYTKEWWGYMWDYYKVHFWVTVLIIGAIIITVMQILSQPKYLMKVIYAGEGFVISENVNNMFSHIDDDLTDEENDGILFTQFSFDYSDVADIQYTVAMEQKLQVEFFVDETMLYLMDETKYKQLRESELFDNVWLPVTEWADKMPDEELMLDENAVLLKDSKLFKEYDINGDKVYLCVRKCYDEKDKKAMKRYEYSKKVANMLIEE